MFLNGIEYPNQILDAIKNNSLVVFAGAGASMGAPTNLPNFKDMCDKIADGSSFERTEEVSCEIFLGTLKAHDINVNEIAAEILSDSCKKHNKEHEAIVNLFLDSKNIKIVTTNYDQMFEQVTSVLNVPVYNSPALPLGNDFTGIIHIHGNVNCPRYMVVTDEDFGNAYLTSGYASKFLTQLLESYTVLFIGYSYDDTIVKYLTRAMARNHKQNRYILTDNDGQNWCDLGIHPIAFPKGAFVKMVESLEKLGERAKRSLVEWKAYLNEISEAPPLDQTIDSEVEYCLENSERARILANCIEGNSFWSDFLSNHKVFDNLFSDSKFNEFDMIWADWFCKKILGKNDELFFKLLINHSNRISSDFAEKIISRMEEDSFPVENIGEYIVLCEKNFTNTYQVHRLIERCYESNQLHLCEMLYKKYWDIELKPEPKYWIDESFDYKHVFWGDVWITRHTWEKCQWGINKDYAKGFLKFFRGKLDEMFFKYRCVGAVSDTVEPWHLSMHVIEEREENYHEEMLDCLVEQIQQLCQTVEAFDIYFVRSYISDGLQAKPIFVRKLFLKLLRVTNVFSVDESFELFEKGDFFDFKAGKEQVFLLIKKIFNDLSEKNRNQFIKHIEEMELIHDYSEYEKYNWCVWIKTFCSDNDRINAIEREILSRNSYEPRLHPELDIYTSSCSWGSDKSPISAEELKTLGCENAFAKVLEYKDDIWGEVNRHGLLNIFSKVVSDNYSWAVQIAVLINSKDVDSDLWSCCFRGFQSEKYSNDEIIELIDKLVKGRKSSKLSVEIAELIWKMVQRDSFKNEYRRYEKRVFAQIQDVWNNRTDEEVACQRVIDYTLNTTVGIILHSVIYLISYNEENELEAKYKEFIEKALTIKGWERKIAVCMIAGHFNFFFFRDNAWTIQKFETILRGKIEQDYVPAWEGIVWFSRSLNRDVADAMSKIYYEAITHIGWLSGETKKGLMELYLTLLIYVIPNPISKYIPRFYKFASLEDRVDFLEGIEHRLWNMEDVMQKQWWDSWLKRFFENLKSRNKPAKMEDSELKVLLNCVAKMKSIYPEAVDIVVKGYLPSNVEDIIFHEIKENDKTVSYPNSTAKLVTAILNARNSFNHSHYFLREVLKDLNGLSSEAQISLDEAILKQNIQL